MCGQDGQAGWVGGDPWPGAERAVLVAVGALTTLPVWLWGIELLPAVAGGSDSEATNGPVSWSLTPIDQEPRGMPPRLGTLIAVAAEQQPRPCRVACRAQPGQQHYMGKPHAIMCPAKGQCQGVPHRPLSLRV